MTTILGLALVFGAPALKEKPGSPAGLESEWQGEQFTDSGGAGFARADRTRHRFEAAGVWRLLDDGDPPHEYRGHFEVVGLHEPNHIQAA